MKTLTSSLLKDTSGSKLFFLIHFFRPDTLGNKTFRSWKGNLQPFGIFLYALLPDLRNRRFVSSISSMTSWLNDLYIYTMISYVTSTLSSALALIQGSCKVQFPRSSYTPGSNCHKLNDGNFKWSWGAMWLLMPSSKPNGLQHTSSVHGCQNPAWKRSLADFKICTCCELG